MPWEFLEQYFHNRPASVPIKERPSSIHQVFTGHPLLPGKHEHHLISTQRPLYSEDGVRERVVEMTRE